MQLVVQKLSEIESELRTKYLNAFVLPLNPEINKVIKVSFQSCDFQSCDFWHIPSSIDSALDILLDSKYAIIILDFEELFDDEEIFEKEIALLYDKYARNLVTKSSYTEVGYRKPHERILFQLSSGGVIYY